MRDIRLIAHNLRSTHNVGSLLRTCEGLGISKVYLTGYTPYPLLKADERLPHIANKLNKQIHKTALDAETIIKWEHTSDIEALLANLAESGFEIIGLEQNTKSIKLPDYTPSDKVAIIVGREVEGIESELLDKCDKVVEIPMFGRKESFNVVQAAAMTLYHCTFYPF